MGMRRRGFLGALGSAAVAWPLASRAHQTSLPVVGFLHSASAEANQKRRAAFLDGLTATGYVAGRNVTIEYRWADGEFVRLPLLAEQLVRHPVSVLVAFAPPTVLAARTATATIPIVFFMGGDPVKLGLVQSFSRPGGNITGIAAMTISLVAKRLELIRSLVPHADTVAFVFNPSNPTAAEQLEAVHSAAQSLGQNVIELGVRNETELEALANTITRVRPKALVIGADSFLISQRNKLVALAARHSLPAIYETRDSVVSGGLVSYAPDFDDGYRQTGIYVGRILKGERPADLPVVQPTKFELVINLKTAKALGITVPLTLQASADEVIE
jgi:putative ABC transport system substrate-binding protein